MTTITRNAKSYRDKYTDVHCLMPVARMVQAARVHYKLGGPFKLTMFDMTTAHSFLKRHKLVSQAAVTKWVLRGGK